MSSSRGDPTEGRQATLQSEHATVAEAFAAIDATAAQMVQTGVRSDAIAKRGR